MFLRRDRQKRMSPTSSYYRAGTISTESAVPCKTCHHEPRIDTHCVGNINTESDWDDLKQYLQKCCQRHQEYCVFCPQLCSVNTLQVSRLLLELLLFGSQHHLRCVGTIIQIFILKKYSQILLFTGDTHLLNALVKILEILNILQLTKKWSNSLE